MIDYVNLDYCDSEVIVDNVNNHPTNTVKENQIVKTELKNYLMKNLNENILLDRMLE